MHRLKKALPMKETHQIRLILSIDQTFQLTRRPVLHYQKQLLRSYQAQGLPSLKTALGFA
jgi:hypothetical protein